MEAKRHIRVLSLLSGGLDSQLAVCVLREQGIEVHGVVFESPFFGADAARVAADRFGIILHAIDFSKEIISLLDEPKHGFGSCMNPCIDCHAMMLRRAGEMLEEKRCHFISTGEVLNQRPLSQNMQSLMEVAKESGYEDYIVRPLSARLLPETKVERDGLVDREKLLALQGRSRREQFSLAAKYGLHDFPTPAGGCRLTEPNFCRRLKDLKDHEGLGGVRSLMLLRFGRHFRLADKLKIIIGRNEKDNIIIEGLVELYDFVLKVENFSSPTCLLPFTATQEQVKQAAAMCARYSDCPRDVSVNVKVRSSLGVTRVKVMPARDEEIEKLRI